MLLKIFKLGVVLIISVTVVTAWVAAAAPQKKACDGLIAALGRAQGDYNRARSARITAEGDFNRAKNRVGAIVAKIKTNEAQQSKAETALDQLKEEQAHCENANGDLSPLSGSCASVQARIDKAKKEIAALRSAHDQLMDQRMAADMDVERTERDLAARRAAESAALAALDKAKKDAAGCRRAA
jgi:chromosome segregation ATPase